jgi:RHS repeat-associated protein
MTTRRATSIALLLLTFGACGISTDVDTGELPLAKVAPAAVSNPAAWSLFDRSVERGFEPTAETVRVDFDKAEQLSALKVYGPSPYRLEVRGSGGTSIGFPSVDLSKLRPGWNIVESTAMVATSRAELRFQPLGSATKIPELELWAVDTGERSEPEDLSQPNLPARFVTLRTSSDGAELSAEACASFELEIARASSTFDKAYIAYDAEGLFRSFAVRMSVNGLVARGGTWLADPTRSKRSFVEEVSPDVLRLGRNEVVMCVPAGASNTVKLSNVRVIGRLDRGVGLISALTIGNDSSDVVALHDAQDTAASIAAGTRAAVAFDRLIAPDALVVSGRGLNDNTISGVECAGLAEAHEPIPIRSARATADGFVFELDGGAKKCVGLNLAFASSASVADVDVVGSGAAERVDWPRIVVTSAREHFGEIGWVAGFVTRPSAMRGAIKIDVAGTPAPSNSGDFGQVLRRKNDVTATWPVVVTAKYPDATAEQKHVVLNGDARPSTTPAAANALTATSPADDAMFGHVGKNVVGRATLMQSAQIRLGTRVGIDIPLGAVTTPTTITARHLGAAALPPLDPGMINVTAPKGHGYEFLPHGQRFARTVDVTVPFDPKLVPSSMSADDVRTFYFDTKAKRWKELDRKHVDVQAHVTRSVTDHFTIMINAVLATPTNPTPLSFDPTSVSSIGAATPAAGIDLIDPPGANSEGDARLGLPIRLPTGRGAYTPSLAISYSSAAENGWLGVGWSLSTSSVGIDTRWGTPTYADGEEPRYMLDGAALVPTDDIDGPACTAGGTPQRYHTRVEGAFVHILRCGSDPSSYYFQVHDRDGTKFIYGSETPGVGNASVQSTKPRPCGTVSCPPGVFRWNLRRVEDVYGNATTFEYYVDDTPGAELGRAVYPQRIVYTSHPTLPAKYEVELILDNAGRFDRISSGRGGFKMLTRRLLRAVRVKFDTQIVREYVLTYAHGDFDKTVLANVRMYGTGGCNASLDAFATPSCGGTFHEHDFEYIHEIPAFGNAEPWEVQGDPTGSQATLGKGGTSTFSGGFSIGAQKGPLSGSVGVNGSTGKRAELVGVNDVNGDGLADQLFDTGSSILVLYNQGAAQKRFSSAGPSLAGTPPADLGRERHGSWGVDVSAGIKVGGFGASASGGFSNSTSRSGRFLTDLDGDGFIDVVASGAENGATLFSSPCGSAHCFTAAPYGSTSAVDPAADALLQDFASEINSRLVLGDPVVQWTAPYTGTIGLVGQLSLSNPGAPSEVKVSLYRNDTLIWAGPQALTKTNPSANIAINPLSVVTGDRLYLRVMTGGSDGVVNGVRYDEVGGFLKAIYMTACRDATCASNVTVTTAMKEPINEPVFVFDWLAGKVPVTATRPLRLPVAGTAVLSGQISKLNTAAPVRTCLQRFPQGTIKTDVPCSASTNIWGPTTFTQAAQTQQLNLTFGAYEGDYLILRAESDFSINPGGMRLLLQNQAPFVSYTQACIPNGSGCTQTSDPAALAEIQLDLAPFGFFVAPVSRSEPVGAVPLAYIAQETNTYHLSSFPNPMGNGHPITVGIRSSALGTMQVFSCVNTCVLPTPNIAATQGDSISIEIIPDPWLWPPVSTSVVLLTDFGLPRYVPLIFRKKLASPVSPTPFVGGFRGWRVSFWNENLPFAPNQLLADYADPDPLTYERYVEMSISALEPIPWLYGVTNIPAWRGRNSSAFVTYGNRVHAARIGAAMPVFPGDSPYADGGVFGNNYVRLSATRSFYAAAGISGGSVVPGDDVMPDIESQLGASLSCTVSRSETWTTSDVLDVTGDGIADVVAGNRTFNGSLSSLSGQQLQGLQFGDAFRRRVGLDYTVGAGTSASKRQTRSNGRPLVEDMDPDPPTGLGYNTSVGLSVGRSQTTDDLVDINADGLPDLVRREGSVIKVRYNFGTSLGAEETFGTIAQTFADAAIDDFQSIEQTSLFGHSLTSTADALAHDTTLTQHVTTTFNALFVSYSKTVRVTSSRTTRQITDLNGDGLPDLVMKTHGGPLRVQFNRGEGFVPTISSLTMPSWPGAVAPTFDSKFNPLLGAGGLITGPDVLAGTSSQASTSDSASVSIPIIGDYVSLGLSGAHANDNDTYELALMDLNGDGTADHVLRRGQSNATYMYVKPNQLTGHANLLREVRRPLGGRFTLEYAEVGHTVNMPELRHVLSRVEVNDGVDLGVGFASPNIVTTFEYENGFHHRHEKEFFGFAKVRTRRMDNGVGTVLEQQFNNQDYTLRGRVTRETLRDHLNRVYSDHVITFDVRAVLGPNFLPLVAQQLCMQNRHPLLERVGASACTPMFAVVIQDTDTRSEGAPPAKTRTVLDTDFDRFGNVIYSVDTGDAAIVDDEVNTKANYQNDTTRWILGRPTFLEVWAQNALVRYREGFYDSNGKLEQLNVDTGNGLAKSIFGYDAVGNLRKVGTPPNESGETQAYVIDYDSVVGTYPVHIENAFGESSDATYDFRFGVAASETDVNHATILRTFDSFGRLETVHGPYDTSQPALSFEYHPEENPPRAVTVTRSSAPPDFSGPTAAPITVVTIADGLGRAIELRRTAVVEGVAGMTTSGLVELDALGRTRKSYQPFFTAGASASFITPSVTFATTTDYDVLDRPILVTHPDNATEATSYGIEAPNGTNALLFRVRNTDANGHARETFADQLGRTRFYVEHPTSTTSATTSYGYYPTGELATIEDAEAHVTRLGYDMRGLRTKFENDDTGLIEDFYDLMGNKIRTIEPNHRALGASVNYRYKRNRLTEIHYPSKPLVRFTYGELADTDGRIGRIKLVEDETGTQEHFYGALGEPRRTIRTVLPGPNGGDTLQFDLKLTSDSLGRLLQIQYPDGELVTNTYDLAGNVAQVTGAGAGWSRTYADQLQYDVFGNRTRLRLGNQVTTTWSYDPQRVRLSSVVTTLPSAQRVQDLHYTYDPAGNPKTLANQLAPLANATAMPGPSSLAFDYDGVDRLLSAIGTAELEPGVSSSYNESFTYSPSHNILTKARDHLIGGAPVAQTTFNSTYAYVTRPHLPEQIGSDTVTYDPSGNPITRKSTAGAQALVWDDDNHLATLTSATVIQHNTYDAAGLRVRRQMSINGAGPDTVFAGVYYQVEGDYSVANGYKGLKHIFAGDLRIASALDSDNYDGALDPAPPATPAVPFYFATDHLGSTSVVTAEDGSVYQSLEYFVDGETWIDRAPHDPVTAYLFNGKAFDGPTGLYDYGQRFYDPRTSLWLGVDPAFVESPDVTVGRPLMLSVGAYAGWSPVLLTDPDGRFPGLSDIGGFVADVGKAAVRGARNGVTKLGNFASNAYHDPVGTAWSIGKRAACPLCALHDDAQTVAGFSADMYIAARDKGVKGVVEKIAEKGGEYLVYYAATRGTGTVTRAVKNATRGSVATAPAATAPAVGPAIRPATRQPVGGGGVVLRDGAGATAAEIAASRGGPTGGTRVGQAAVRREIIEEADAAGGVYRCWRCGQTSTNPSNMHLGHRNVSTSAGGNLERVNVCLEGAACNLSTGDRGGPSPGMSCAERGGCGAPYGRFD